MRVIVVLELKQRMVTRCMPSMNINNQEVHPLDSRKSVSLVTECKHTRMSLTQWHHIGTWITPDGLQCICNVIMMRVQLFILLMNDGTIGASEKRQL